MALLKAKKLTKNLSQTMFDIDKWQEIFESIKHNKLRTFLTGFSIAWGIFMLIILLGTGQGLENGVIHEFKDDAINSMKIFGRRTSVPYNGFNKDRRVNLTNTDFDLTKELNPEDVKDITVRYFVGRDVRNMYVRYKNKTGSFDIRCTHPDHQIMEETTIVEGRFLNEIDMARKRKVIVIGKPVKELLFEKEPAIGKFVEINGVMFKVVGIFTDEGRVWENNKVYIPVYTAQEIFGDGVKVHEVLFTTDLKLKESQDLAKNIYKQYAIRHTFNPNDDKAIRIDNRIEDFQDIIQLFLGIRIFIWIIGLGTLIAGIVGVSNIMYIVVKERTKEIGIRKAIGAKPNSIILMILLESLFITCVAGYFGMSFGIFIVEMVSKNIPSSGFFRQPGVDMRVAIAATVVLVIAGLTAGFFPARKAAKIKPVIALRDE